MNILSFIQRMISEECILYMTFITILDIVRYDQIQSIN